MTPAGSSPFRAAPQSEWIAENRSAFAIPDQFPVSVGHALVVPFRQIATWWEAEPSEQADLLALVGDVKAVLDNRHRPDGYNVGFNAGRAAGQTVDHFHIHVIPRYVGDVPDPRGGVRHVIPNKGNYLVALSEDGVPGGEIRLLDGSLDEGRLMTDLVSCLTAPEVDRIDLVVSFIIQSGLALIFDHLDDAVERGATVRILTTDYLEITDPDALAHLLDLQESSPPASGAIVVKVWRDVHTSFHPKAYIFSSSKSRSARGFVGSSNLSKSGIDGGVEWNLEVRSVDQLIVRFNALWNDHRATALTHEFLRDYRRLRKEATLGTEIPTGVEVEPPRQPVAPTEIQREALTALETSRLDGHQAGLVVMATGLGKTWLAAFDSSRPAVHRTLFVAHREEILIQSRDIFRQVRTDAELGLFYGKEKQADADVVFASVQTLSSRLHEFDPDEFDYIVVDEFHHASASSYRKVINHFSADFLLGLTATPDRMDGADLLALCGDNLVFDCNLVEGIRRDELVPFHYRGHKDVTDFQPIPWRNGKFDPEALALAVETQDRAQQSVDAWRDHGGGPTLGFCCSISYARFLAGYFSSQGISAVAVHSGAESAPRRQAVEQLRGGSIDVIFTVDVFNEGIDIPQVETVMMLRPTESSIVFLQQLGRGLRKSPGKEQLKVIDFIGNHHSFLNKPRVLLSLGSNATPTQVQVIDAMKTGDFDLPVGCSVAYDLEAIDLLAAMIRNGSRDALADFCREYTESNGYRPSAIQALRSGFNPRSARAKHGHWFGLLSDLGILSEDAKRVVAQHGDTLVALEKESITKSYKLVTLRALLHDGTLRSGADVAQIAATAHHLICADPRLVRDVTSKEILDPLAAGPSQWEQFWRKWPVEHLTHASSGSALFQLDATRLRPTFQVSDELGDVFDSLVAEIVEWRLAEYLLRDNPASTGSIRCAVSHTDGRPIIRIDRTKHPELPEGWTDVIADGEILSANFVKVAINMAERPGEQGNALHSLLRGWFGPSAGHPGTKHSVLLRQTSEGWEIQPDAAYLGTGGELIRLFPTYEVACGALDTPLAPTEGQMIVLQPSSNYHAEPQRQFVAFAAGNSMDGGPDPVRPGDPLLFEWVRDVGRADLEGQRVLVQQTATEGTSAALKRLERSNGGWILTSDAAGEPDIAGQPDMRVVARLVSKLDQAAINPLSSQIGETHKRAPVPAFFGDEYSFGKWGQSGHVTTGLSDVLFVTTVKEGMDQGSEYTDYFAGPDRLVWSSQNATSPETTKGRGVLESPSNGRLVHLWARKRAKEVAFTYCGVLIPLTHSGAKPMSVTFRLLTPLSEEMQNRLLG
jgi:superfamily II DNA or RNA helicase/diadenosine tetraphosphate (Ap4A) HIT family hydrolase/HKD family nuclease